MYPRQYFDLWHPDINEDMVFVGMSFNPDESWRWHDIIRPAIVLAGFMPLRVDEPTISDSILIDILAGIASAKLLVIDISSDSTGMRNGNVMYELGLAHATRHADEVIIIRSDQQHIIFDIAQVRVHSYDASNPRQAMEHLAGLVRERAEAVQRTKALVLHKTVSLLDEICLGFLSAHAEMDLFSAKNPERAYEPESVEGRAAVRRLLELGTIRLVWEKESKKYAFTWTSLGRALLAELGFVSEVNPGMELGYSDKKSKEGETST